ncbi:hypothetical protein NEMIN01_0413 [Nematocida minor]|uniref:uncharacterized protein n=1 Tax=Nematocida minor TaxID=1912983 RepID=UPI00221FA406|nr:uncharacterized protein NEMIN01_0413 [Nematocida minor]KAI5189247.1 hypothetical protein NEMIN01_0413 [Nematocida minor]
MQLSVGDVFKSKNEAQNAIRMYAIDNSFNFETTDSTPKKYTIQCKERRTHGCDAVITAALRKKDNMFVIKKLKNAHNCPQQSSLSVQSSGRYIADEIREMQDVEDTRIGQIINRISSRRGIKIGYYAAWKAKKNVLNDEIDEEAAQEECLQSVVEENSHINPDDTLSVLNMKKEIEKWRSLKTQSEETGCIRQVIRAIGPLDTAGSRLDTLFYASNLSLHVYSNSRQVIDLTVHERCNELREHAGYAYIATGYDAFDTPYILAMCYVPEYCPKKEGWIVFMREMLKVIDSGVFMMDWEGCHATIEEIEELIRDKNSSINSTAASGSLSSYSDASPLYSMGIHGENPWKGHFDIEEAIRAGDVGGPGSGRGSKVRLFLRTRSLCKAIFATHPVSSAISLVWSLCNSPDLPTFQVYYKKVKALGVPSLLSLLSSLPTHLWAKYLCEYPIYGKNNSVPVEIDGVLGMLTLSPIDALCMVIKIISDNALKKKEIVAHAELSTKKATDRARFGESVNRAVDINILKSQSYDADIGRAPGELCRSSWIDPRRLNDEEEHKQGIVYSGNLKFYVDLRLRVCSCMKFQDMNYPCSHACALITKVGGHCNAYIDEMYSIDALMAMYKPYTTRCIVAEPIKGTEERRRPCATSQISLLQSNKAVCVGKRVLGYDTEEFAEVQEHKENLVR